MTFNGSLWTENSFPSFVTLPFSDPGRSAQSTCATCYSTVPCRVLVGDENCDCQIPQGTCGAVRMLSRNLHNHLFSMRHNPSAFRSSSQTSPHSLLLISFLFFRHWASGFLGYDFGVTWPLEVSLSSYTFMYLSLGTGACQNADYRHPPLTLIWEFWS